MWHTREERWNCASPTEGVGRKPQRGKGEITNRDKGWSSILEKAGRAQKRELEMWVCKKQQPVLDSVERPQAGRVPLPHLSPPPSLGASHPFDPLLGLPRIPAAPGFCEGREHVLAVLKYNIRLKANYLSEPHNLCPNQILNFK